MNSNANIFILSLMMSIVCLVQTALGALPPHHQRNVEIKTLLDLPGLESALLGRPIESIMSNDTGFVVSAGTCKVQVNKIHVPFDPATMPIGPAVFKLEIASSKCETEDTTGNEFQIHSMIQSGNMMPGPGVVKKPLTTVSFSYPSCREMSPNDFTLKLDASFHPVHPVAHSPTLSVELNQGAVDCFGLARVRSYQVMTSEIPMLYDGQKVKTVVAGRPGKTIRVISKIVH